jgi:hypothetical protein
VTSPVCVVRRVFSFRLALVVLLLVGSCALLAACGSPTRSVAAYCSYFYGEGGQLRERWIKASNSDSGNPFGELSSVFADVPEAASFMHELSLRAPETIAPDVRVLAEALKRLPEQMGSAATDPLGVLAGDMVDGLETSGAEQRVNAYTEQYCGEPAGSNG